MHNNNILIKENTQTTNKNSYQGNYVKIYNNLPTLFKAKKVSALAQLIYMTMATYVVKDSSLATIKQSTIMATTGLSRKCVYTYTQELIDKGFIQKIYRSNYHLLVGVYNGLKEFERVPDTHSEKEPLYERVPDTHSHARAFLFYTVAKKKQHVKPTPKKQDDAAAIFFNSLKSYECFLDTNENNYFSWVRKYDFDTVKRTMLELTKKHKGEKVNAAEICWTLKNREMLDQEQKAKGENLAMEENKERENQDRVQEQVAQADKKIMGDAQEIQEKFDADLNESSTDIERVSEIRQNMLSQHRNVSEELFEAILASSIVKDYRERNQNKIPVQPNKKVKLPNFKELMALSYE